MPVGQFTGTRAKYVYTTDTDDQYILELDTTLAALSTTLTAFDPASPGDATPAPKRFTPRGVHWQGTATGFERKRKFIVCGQTDDTLYDSSTSQVLTIDGAAGKTTGRKGEKLTF
jgi:hypothetical protein